MFSPEFMKFLIKYQSSDCDKKTETKTIYFKYKSTKLAPVYLINKR